MSMSVISNCYKKYKNTLNHKKNIHTQYTQYEQQYMYNFTKRILRFSTVQFIMSIAYLVTHASCQLYQLMLVT